jgi:hypothetical protein
MRPEDLASLVVDRTTEPNPDAGERCLFKLVAALAQGNLNSRDDPRRLGTGLGAQAADGAQLAGCVAYRDRLVRTAYIDGAIETLERVRQRAMPRRSDTRPSAPAALPGTRAPSRGRSCPQSDSACGTGSPAAG